MDEAVQVVNTAALRAQSSAIASAVEEAKLRGPRLRVLSPYYGEFGSEDTEGLAPWDAGYLWARRLRQRLELDGQPLRTTDSLGDALKIGKNAFYKATKPVNLLNRAPLVDGIVVWNEDESVPSLFASWSVRVGASTSAELLARS